MTVAGPRQNTPRLRPPSPRRGVYRRRGGHPILGTGATSWYDARDITTTTQQTLTSRVGSGTATLGSTGTSDTNDPTVLPYPGSTPYVYIPGTSGNYISVPDSAALDITGDIDLRCTASLRALSGTTQTLIVKRPNAFQFRVESTGHLGFLWFSSTAPISATSTVTLASVGLSANTIYHFRVTLDVDNGATGNDTKFYYSTDGSNWTQLGSTVTKAGVTSIDATTDVVSVGNWSLNEPSTGAFYRAMILNGINGSTVLDINPATETLGQASWTCTTGQTVTVNRATSGLTTAVVTRPLLMADGTDDFVQLPAGDKPSGSPATLAFTQLVVLRHPLAIAGASEVLWSCRSSVNVGLEIDLSPTLLRIQTGDGSASPTITDLAVGSTADGTIRVHGISYNGSGTLTVFSHDGTTASSTTASVSGLVLSPGYADPRIGTLGYTVSFNAKMEWFAGVTFQKSLTVAQMTAAAIYLLGTYA